MRGTFPTLGKWVFDFFCKNISFEFEIYFQIMLEKKLNVLKLIKCTIFHQMSQKITLNGQTKGYSNPILSVRKQRQLRVRE